MSIPVHIISGFLGSGKTTLMNHLLRTKTGSQKFALIVNDFGKIPLDGDLLDREGYTLKELSSGCVCCTLRGPLSDTLAAFALEEHPDIILMETTGVAIPAELATVFRSEELEDLVRIGNIVSVVDANSFLKYEPHFQVLGKQVRQANTILMNKVDQSAPDSLAAVRNRIKFLSMPEAIMTETDHCQIAPELILNSRQVYLPNYLNLAGHEATLQSFSYETQSRFSLEKVKSFLQKLPDCVVRAKGIVCTDVGVRVIQLTTSGCEITGWEGETEQSRLVFIGEGLLDDDLEIELEECLAE
jgi:G3E family GTPase